MGLRSVAVNVTAVCVMSVARVGGMKRCVID